LSLEGDHTPRRWLATGGGETHPAFSPDGRHVAYASRESGDWHVLVRALEGRSPVEQVSIETGWEPLWSMDGKEILFRSLDGKKIFAAPFEAGPRPRIGRPRLVLEGNFFGGTTATRNWELAPDDSRFLLWEMSDPAPPVPHFNVVLNFLDEVERKLAGRATP
jgi:dipeptidyl aminopeptidase/acylaminoacyl peptidase